MRNLICRKLILAGACAMTGVAAWGQQAQPLKLSVDVAVVYHPLLTNRVGGSNFWMQGGSVQLHGQFRRGLGVVADVSGEHAGVASENGQ